MYEQNLAEPGKSFNLFEVVAADRPVAADAELVLNLAFVVSITGRYVEPS
jgi:hypothetical protein